MYLTFYPSSATHCAPDSKPMTATFSDYNQCWVLLQSWALFPLQTREGWSATRCCRQVRCLGVKARSCCWSANSFLYQSPVMLSILLFRSTVHLFLNALCCCFLSHVLDIKLCLLLWFLSNLSITKKLGTEAKLLNKCILIEQSIPRLLSSHLVKLPVIHGSQYTHTILICFKPHLSLTAGTR